MNFADKDGDTKVYIPVHPWLTYGSHIKCLEPVKSDFRFQNISFCDGTLRLGICALRQQTTVFLQSWTKLVRNLSYIPHIVLTAFFDIPAPKSMLQTMSFGKNTLSSTTKL